jgi:RimJ/RimL family protein N-acetyltransferase
MIRTARLSLRPAEWRDLEAFHAILSDERAMRYWSTLPHGTLEQSRAWLQAMIDVTPREGEDWVIDLDGQAIGKAGLWRFPEIGFILHPDHWGRGYTREALQPVISRAFAVHRLPSIFADVDPRNAASLTLLRGLGFVETGRARRTLRLGEEWCDSVYLQLESPER